MEPYLKWAGSKRTIAPTIKSIFNQSGCESFVEPFCGSLSVALTVQCPQTRVADINNHLINLHREIQQNPSFPDMLLLNNASDYRKLRDEFNALAANKENSRRSAELFYFLLRTCFNGLCRFNKKGEFNVGFANYKKPILNSDFREYSQLMQNWEIETKGYKESLLNLTSKDFVFVDPPYDGCGFVGYWGDGFSWDDQQELAQILADSSAKVMITNGKTDRLISLYQSLGFDVYSHLMPRRIACNGDRAKAQEIIALRGMSEADVKILRGNLTSMRKARSKK